MRVLVNFGVVKKINIFYNVKDMIDLEYSLIIEATEDPEYFGFYSPDLEGFTGIGNSIEDCVYKAKWGMKEHIKLLRENGLTIPPKSMEPRIVIQNEKQLLPV